MYIIQLTGFPSGPGGPLSPKSPGNPWAHKQTAGPWNQRGNWVASSCSCCQNTWMFKISHDLSVMLLHHAQRSNKTFPKTEVFRAKPSKSSKTHFQRFIPGRPAGNSTVCFWATKLLFVHEHKTPRTRLNGVQSCLAQKLMTGSFFFALRLWFHYRGRTRGSMQPRGHMLDVCLSLGQGQHATNSHHGSALADRRRAVVGQMRNGR